MKEAFELAVGDLHGDTLEIELDFSSVDAASVAFGANEPTLVRELSPATARTLEGLDVTNVLAQRDLVRFDTVRGDVAELSFKAPAAPASGSMRSFILETSGFYVPEIAPAIDADPAAMDALIPFSASRLALALRLATRARSTH